MPDFETSTQFEANAQFRAYGEILDEDPDAIAVRTEITIRITIKHLLLLVFTFKKK